MPECRNVGRDQLNELNIRVPPVSEQKASAYIGKLDDKIQQFLV